MSYQTGLDWREDFRRPGSLGKRGLRLYLTMTLRLVFFIYSQSLIKIIGLMFLKPFIFRNLGLVVIEDRLRTIKTAGISDWRQSYSEHYFDVVVHCHIDLVGWGTF